MTYTAVRELERGDKVRPKAGGPFAIIVQVTDNFVRLNWYDDASGNLDIIGKISPLWATLEHVQ